MMDIFMEVHVWQRITDVMVISRVFSSVLLWQVGENEMAVASGHMNSSGVLLEVGSVLPVLHSGEMQSAPGAVPASPAASGNLGLYLYTSPFRCTFRLFYIYVSSLWREMKDIQPGWFGGFMSCIAISVLPSLSLLLFFFKNILMHTEERVP